MHWTKEQLMAEMAIEADKLERLAREVRAGKWETLDIEENINRRGQGIGLERATVLVRVSRIQKEGTGIDLSAPEAPPPRGEEPQGTSPRRSTP